jgi:hypothetical protein
MRSVLPERHSGAPQSYHASAERVCRWLADERDELDKVVIRTWN